MEDGLRVRLSCRESYSPTASHPATRPPCCAAWPRNPVTAEADNVGRGQGGVAGLRRCGCARLIGRGRVGTGRT
eukprot:1710437-Prymnesium_polylepis.1